MALTKAREIALFQVLEVPYATQASVVNNGELSVATTDVTGDTNAAKTVITTYVNALIADVDVAAVLTTLLDRWVALGTDTTTVSGGQVGEISGVTVDPAAERLEIRRQTLVLVPFWHYHEEIERSQAASRTIIPKV